MCMRVVNSVRMMQLDQLNLCGARVHATGLPRQEWPISETA